jgi:hypothetical protein
VQGSEAERQRFEEALEALEQERQRVDEDLRRLTAAAAYLRALLPIRRRSGRVALLLGAASFGADDNAV